MLFLLRLVARLPLPLLHALGAALGWVAYLCSPRYRWDFRRNLDAARLCDPRLRRAAVAEAGKCLVETPAIWLRPLERVAELVVETEGLERLDKAAKDGRGVIVVTPHIGCWEMVGQYVASRIPMTAMYRTPKVSSL
jgi:KDO2-lipid IV(A) lauroyltransferase